MRQRLAIALLLLSCAWTQPPQKAHPADKYQSDLPLGALREATATRFRVFAPEAPGVRLRLYGSRSGTFAMSGNPDGTWEVLCPDLPWDGSCQYTFEAWGKEVIDPYARCLTGHDGRGVLYQDDTPLLPRPSFPPEEAILYELHLRDFTLDPDSGIQRRGKYLGLTEEHTRLFPERKLSTGLDHLVELGVNTVQILPLSEFANDEQHDRYGWGYDSVHFNSPEGWYASRREDGTRVKEYKLMVNALHRRGLRVVMDMVYNHTMEQRAQGRLYSFEGLAPGYYYRLKPDGSYYDGSGVGNEFRSEAPMARRFLRDSCRYWVEEMGVDGFRFDLMGLIDRETIRLITEDLKRIDSNLLIYGEPWAAGTTPIEVTAKGSQKGLGYAVFNDDFRDALKGHVFQPEACGYVQNGSFLERVRCGIEGSLNSFAEQPTESINYVECHDNHTLWDRLSLSMPAASTAERLSMQRLATAIVLTSQGIPFLHSGQELCRTKWGHHNSYDQPDALNMIRWHDKQKQAELVAYIQGLIALRRAHPMFRMGRAELVRQHLRWEPAPEPCLSYCLSDPSGTDSWQKAQVLINPGRLPQTFSVAAGFQVWSESQRALLPPGPRSVTRVQVPARQLMILAWPKNL